MALRALPQQLGAAVAAADTDVRVEIEDGVAGEAEIAFDQLRIASQSRQRLPDFLVDHQGVRVVRERLEEQLEGPLASPAALPMAGQRQPRAPVLRVGRDQTATEVGESLRRALVAYAA